MASESTTPGSSGQAADPVAVVASNVDNSIGDSAATHDSEPVAASNENSSATLEEATPAPAPVSTSNSKPKITLTASGFPVDLSVLTPAECTDLCIDVCEVKDAEYLINLCTVPQFDVNAQDEVGYLPLIYAVTFSSFECFHVLLEAGANASLPARDQSTCLHVAAQYGLAEYIDPLVEAKANVNAAMPNGARPLDVAITNKHPKCVELLVKHKVDVHYVKSMDSPLWPGQSPIRMAATLNNLEIFQCLLAGGADPLDETKILPTTVAQDLIHRKQFKFLDAVSAEYHRTGGQGCLWDDDEGGSPCYFNAIYESSPEAFEFMVDRGVDLELTDEAGNTALFVAAYENNLEVVRTILDLPEPDHSIHSSELLSYGNYCLKDGFGILHLAVENKNIELQSTLQAKEIEFGFSSPSATLQNPLDEQWHPHPSASSSFGICRPFCTSLR